MSPCSSFIFCPILTVITFLFGLTVHTSSLFQYAYHQITLEMSYPCTIWVPHFQASYSCIGSCHGGSYMYPASAWIYNHNACTPVSLKITQPVTFLPKPDCFFSTYCLKITPHLQSTIISKAKCCLVVIFKESMSLCFCQWLFFCTSCWLHFCGYWSADICLHERMCLVISFVTFHTASHEHASVRFYYQLCYVTSVFNHSNAQGHQQCRHLG
jgi:hypothetical protein